MGQSAVKQCRDFEQCFRTVISKERAVATDPARTTLSGFEPSKNCSFEKRLWQQRSVSSSPMEHRSERGFEARVRSNATAAARWLRVVLSKQRYSVLETYVRSRGTVASNRAFEAAAQRVRSMLSEQQHSGFEA